MKVLNQRNNIDKIITVSYFTIAFFEIISEAFADKPLLFIFKPIISILLMFLYWNTSKERNLLFFITIFFSLITNIFFIPNSGDMLFYGIIAFLIYRILMIVYIVKLMKFIDLSIFVVTIISLLFLFFYLFSISIEISKNSYYILMIQSVLISILGGIALSDYIFIETANSPWLLICALLSVSHYFIIFLEKYYMSHLSPIIFRPLAMFLNTGVYYSFYRFIYEKENKF